MCKIPPINKSETIISHIPTHYYYYFSSKYFFTPKSPCSRKDFTIPIFIYLSNKGIKSLFWVIYAIIIVPLSFVLLEWYFIGVTMVLMTHLMKNETARRIIPPLFAGVLFLVLSLWMNIQAQMFYQAGVAFDFLVLNPDFGSVMMTFSIGMVVAAFLLKGYNGMRGKKMKWLFYVIYPVHFAVLFAGAVIFRAIGLM